MCYCPLPRNRLPAPARSAPEGVPAVMHRHFRRPTLGGISVRRAIYRLLGSFGSARPQIEARHRAEADLDRTTDVLSAIIQSSPVATQAFALDRTVTMWNPASERLFGWTADELIGRTLPREMTPDDERATSIARIERTIGGATVEGDRVRRLTKSGDMRWIDIYAAPLRNRAGQPIGVVGQLIDVTDRVELEAQLLQAQKMEVVGMLASGLAHDFSNTLAVASGFATLIEETSTEPQIRSDARAILDVVERARGVSRQLLSFARGSDKSSGPVDIRGVVEGILPLLRQLMGPAIHIETQLADEPLIARVDAGQLEQALINLAINARDAMHLGGRLTIAVGPIGRRGSTIEIAVHDSGVGIEPEVQAHMFEPFFTTKQLGKGSGLGLSMVRGFAASAGGDVAVDSTPGRGSTFSIRLPRANRPPNAAG
jgi:PAS domain S-box-containing protein